MSTATQYKFLERDPASSLQQLSIKGRRIRARTLYGCYMSEDEPRTPDQIADDYDVPLDAVLEAIAYCESDPPEIRADMQFEESLMKASGMNDPDYNRHGKPKLLTAEEIAGLDVQ